jgi:shikimate kinase
MSIILFGFKNCGKSTIGSLIAKKLKVPFIDTDRLIEEIYQKEKQSYLKAHEIFILNSKLFRNIERKTVLSLSEIKNVVIATGGGCVLNTKNVKMLKNIGKLVYLKASKELIRKRAFAAERFPAFLDINDKEHSFNEMYEVRKIIYENIADRTIEIDKKDNETIIEEIIDGK